jgi:MFS family permease
LQPRQARLAVVGIGILAVTAAGFVRAPLLPDMGRALALSDTALGAIVSCFAFGRILADIPAGRLTDRVPSGLMMATGAALVGAGSVVSGLAPGPAAAFAGAFVLGIGSAWTNTTGSRPLRATAEECPCRGSRHP